MHLLHLQTLTIDQLWLTLQLTCRFVFCCVSFFLSAEIYPAVPLSLALLLSVFACSHDRLLALHVSLLSSCPSPATWKEGEMPDRRAIVLSCRANARLTYVLLQWRSGRASRRAKFSIIRVPRSGAIVGQRLGHRRKSGALDPLHKTIKQGGLAVCQTHWSYT